MGHNVEKMMFTGKKPWWYGNASQKDAIGVDLGANAVTSEVAMKEAGLDWFAKKVRSARHTGSFDLDGNPVWSEVGGECFLVRETDSSVLGRCTAGYEEFQNAQAFEFLDGFVREGEMLYHTAGSLEGGRRVWILAQTPGSWTIQRRSGARNTHHAFLLCVLGHDGKTGISLMPTDVRAECANTVGWADQHAEGRNLIFRVQHRGNIPKKLELAGKALRVMQDQTPARREVLQAMAQSAMDTDEFIDFATSIFLGLDGDPAEIKDQLDRFYAEATPRSKTIMENKVAKVAGLFEGGQGNEGDSTYDALQAFTEYFDHFDLDGIRDKADRGRRAAKAVSSAWLGAGAERKGLVYKRLRERIAR